MLLAMQAALALTPDDVLARVEATRAHRASSLFAADAPAFTEAMYRAAATGKVETGLVPVEGERAKKAYGVSVLPVGIGALWGAINDDASKPRFTRLDYAEVLEGGACGAKRVVFMHLPITMLANRWWVMDVQQNTGLLAATGGAVREMVWSSRDPVVPATSKARLYTESGVSVRTRGAWWLTALDAQHTLVEYWTWTDPGGSVPAGLASSFAAGGIKDTFEATAALAREGSRCPVD